MTAVYFIFDLLLRRFVLRCDQCCLTLIYSFLITTNPIYIYEHTLKDNKVYQLTLFVSLFYLLQVNTNYAKKNEDDDKNLFHKKNRKNK